MKRLLVMLLSLLLLTGCGGYSPETTLPETSAPVTEPPIPWIEAMGTPWDEEGALTELPLTIPGGLHYSTATAFNGDLLLWSVDDHRETIRTLELCLVELDTGLVTAEREIPFSNFVSPQVLGNSLFLCDSSSGTILELDHALQIIGSWNIDPLEGNLYMGSEGKLYIYQWDGSLWVQDLQTGEKVPLLEEGAYVDYFSPAGNIASFEYYHPVTGEKVTAVLDTATGQVMEPGLDKEITFLHWQNGTWLCESYRDGSVFYISDGSGEFLRAELGYDSLRMIDENTMYRTYEDGCHISLHDMTGASVAKVKLTASPFSYNCSAIIPSEAFGGYFLLVGDYGSSQRLLYWDVSQSAPGEDVIFEPIPEPEEAERRCKVKAEEMGYTYGLNILVGSDCGTRFYDFDAEQVTDWEVVDDALDTLEDALQDYPEGFFRQLRYDTIHSVEIHLAGTLTPTNAEYVDTYEAFVQEEYQKQVMVVDVFQAREQTYYHEFSHIIDAFLAWDSQNREDALFSEEGWNSLNPGWFPGYTYDYSWQQYVQDYSCFVDGYSTIRPTEDRARVLEYAMADHGSWIFADAPVLQAKLDYYCRCIRDAFDTTGWPENLLWEQYLS